MTLSVLSSLALFIQDVLRCSAALKTDIRAFISFIYAKAGVISTGLKCSLKASPFQGNITFIAPILASFHWLLINFRVIFKKLITLKAKLGLATSYITQACNSCGGDGGTDYSLKL